MTATGVRREEEGPDGGSDDRRVPGDAPGDKRAALERLREQFHASAPDATEAIAYGMPGFKLDGRYLVSFGNVPLPCRRHRRSISDLLVAGCGHNFHYRKYF